MKHLSTQSISKIAVMGTLSLSWGLQAGGRDSPSAVWQPTAGHAHTRVTRTLTINLESPNHLIHMSLNCGRNHRPQRKPTTPQGEHQCHGGCMEGKVEDATATSKKEEV